MLIPKKIMLAGLHVEVITAPTLHKDKGLGGYSDYPNQRIILAGDISRQMQEVSFWHECVHFILYVMGEDQLRENEKFVDLFAHFIHQVTEGK